MAKMTQAIRASNLRCCVVAGAAANTDITCEANDGTALAYGDVLVMVMEMTVTTNAWVDRTGNSAIQSDGKLQCTDATDSDVLIVLWEAATSASDANDSFHIMSGIDLSVSAGQTQFDISGITTNDILIAVWGIDGTSGAIEDFTGRATIENDGEVELEDEVSPLLVDDDIYVLYYDVSSPIASHNHCMQPIVATGAGANSDITVTGITTGDRLVTVLELDGTAYTIVADRTSACSITDDDDVQCTASTTGNKLFILWDDTSC